MTTRHHFSRLLELKFRSDRLALLHLSDTLFHRHFCWFLCSIGLIPLCVLFKVITWLDWKVQLNSLPDMMICRPSYWPTNTPSVFEMCRHRVTRDICLVCHRQNISSTWIKFDGRKLALAWYQWDPDFFSSAILALCRLVHWLI